jgi:hypothetical protein
VGTWYDLGKNCAFPGWQRNYGVTLMNPISQTVGLTTEKHFFGNLAGPIFVEAGRSVNGLAMAPGSDDQVIVKVVVHGHLEAALVNPPRPTCG